MSTEATQTPYPDGSECVFENGFGLDTDGQIVAGWLDDDGTMPESPKMPPGLVELGTLALTALAAAEREFPRIMADLAASLPSLPVRRKDDV